ncbi:lycopene cyclase domain-containing protein [Amycolatopsis sp. K13G38]|uniref:Lycopene cyclase domain-containing protein n=1 Tax=Amycolatopsis acididurans TaxID=2724524 RepID=A0ABX1JH23_9PSEU|nr:lycopene cyclase domain-containing protein [Amycolatopsis acididurans]NKQ58956.1 lycopene cyclase domain-containing protein [Amycolatopsis acididurans]
MDRMQYLLLLTACVVVTLPLELTGTRVYRQPGRLARAVLPAALIFLVWDVLAITAGVWTYNPRYLLGVDLPFAVPLEEALFFLVIPLCGLLTYETAERMLARR